MKNQEGFCFSVLFDKLVKHNNVTGMIFIFINPKFITLPSDTVIKSNYLHDRPRISPWIISISSAVNITCHVVALQLSGNCDAINNRLWRHQQNINRGSGKRWWCMRIAVFIVIDWFVCSVIWCLFPSLLRNAGNKHQNNTLLGA